MLSMLLSALLVFSLVPSALHASSDPATPIPTAGLDLWLMADKGVTLDENGKVSSWSDQSGKGNHVTQEDSTMRPSFVTNSEYTTNNMPAVKFENGIGTTPYLKKTLDTPYVGSSSIVMVMKQNALSPNEGKGIFGTNIYSDDNTDMKGAFGIIADWDKGGLLAGGEASNARVSFPSTDYKVIVVTIDADEGTVASYVNGELISKETNVLHKNLNKYAAYAIGRSYWWNSLNASLSEIAVYQNVLTDESRTTIERYLNDKYAVYEVSGPSTMLPIPAEGLDLWLKADTGVTANVYGNVSEWADQSGKGNHVTQADPSLQPTLVTTDNLTAIKFEDGTGSTPFLKKALNSTYVGSSSIVMVMKQNKISIGEGKGIFGTDIFSGQNMAGAFGIVGDWDQGGLLVSGEGPSAKASDPSTVLQILVVTIDTENGTVTSHVNGQLVRTNTADSNKQLNKYVQYAIGRSYWHNSLDASLSELAVYQKVLSDSERQTIESYLNKKYTIYESSAPPVTQDGLNLWLKADEGVIRDTSNRVSVWQDQSGNGNDLAQSSPSFQPRIITDPVNQMPAIKFEQGIGDTPYLSKELDEPYVGSSSLILVMKQNTLAPGEGKGIFGTGLYNGQDLSEMQGVFGVITDWGTGGTLLGGEKANALLRLPATDYAVLSVTIDYETGTVKSYVNGNLLTDSTKEKHKTFSKFSAYTVGRSYWWNSLDANLSEVLVYRDVLEEDDRSAIEQYLLEKYAIDTSGGPVEEPKSLPSPIPAPELTVHAAGTAFGDQQGVDGWYAMKKTGDTYAYLEEYSDEEPAVWKDASGLPYVGSSIFYPSGTADAVKKWVAPRAGNVDVSGVIRKSDSEGNGVIASVFKNKTSLWSATITSQDGAQPNNLTDIHVEAGDVLYFVVNANGDMESDEIEWSPEITLSSIKFMEAESASSASDARIVTSSDAGGGQDIILYGTDTIVYEDVDLSGGFKTLEARLSAISTGGKFEVRLDSREGPVISEFIVANTDGWDRYETQVWSVDTRATGVHDLYIKAVAGAEIARINWFRFTNQEPRGATMPYKTYEAEAANIGGGATLNNDAKVKVASSGKSYVHLDAEGEYVEWTNVRDANRLLLRYSIPQHSSGTIGLYVNGSKVQDISLSATYNYDSLNPNYGRRYDEKEIAIDIHAGDSIRIQKDAGNSLEWYAIDLIDLETAPVPLEQPDNFLSVKDFGALGNGVADDTAAIQTAVDAANVQGKGVWLPEGVFNQSEKIFVPSGVDIQGAGIWYTRLHSTVTVPATDWGGKVGFMMNNDSTVSDLRISGVETNRDNGSAMAIHTVLGTGKHLVLKNMWVEHIGAFYGWEHLEQSLIQDVRIRNTYFDGIHFGDLGNSYNLAHNNSMRGLGDDAIAQVNLTGMATIATHNVGQFNSISALYWGRGLSNVGGNDLTYRDNLIDSIFNAGMIITTEPVTPNSDSYPINTMKFQRNTITRSGHTGHNHAGLHFWLYESPMQDVRVELNLIEQGETEGVHIDDTAYGDSEGRTQFLFNTVRDNALDNYNNASSLINPIMIGNTGLPNNVSKSALLDAINQARALYENAVEGNGDGQYAAGSKAALLAVIEAASAASHPVAATQAQLDEAYAAITQATAQFQSKQVRSQSPVVTTPATPALDRLESSVVNGTAYAKVGKEDLERAFRDASEDPTGSQSIIIKLAPKTDADAYVLQVPAAALKEQSDRRIVIETSIGTVDIASNMLAGTDISNNAEAGIHIGLADSTEWNAGLQEQIGSKPTLELHLIVNGEIVPWNHAAAPVRVSIPYQPLPEEDPEHIVIYYVDQNGKPSTIANGRYNAESGQVTFSTMHFSTFAVAYVKKSFQDLAGYGWAQKQIEVLASKGIINGVNNDAYQPSRSIKRADAVLLLMRALDIPLSAGAETSFTDVRKGDYYYEAVAAAEALGMVKGTGEQTFQPETEISRQDLMVLIHRAMTAIGKGYADGSPDALNGFSDQDQVASYAKESIGSLVSGGIVIGNENRLNPTGPITRAETAVLMYRIYNGL